MSSIKYSRYCMVFLTFMLLLRFAIAEDIDVSYTAINGDIVVGTGSYATFTITIKNNLPESSTVNVRTLDSLDWEVNVEPSTNNRVDIGPNKTGVYLLRINELKRDEQYLKNAGIYKLVLVVESENEKASLPVFVNIVGKEALNKAYQPDLVAKAELNIKRIDPRNKPNLKLLVQNLNLRNLTRIDISIATSKGLIDQHNVVSLGPLEEKVFDFTLNFADDESPKTDSLYVKVETYGDDGQVYPKKQPDPIEYEIIPYATIVRDTQIERKFMKKISVITISNDGNIRKAAEVKVPSAFFERLFTTTVPKAEFTTEDGSYYFVWNVEVDGKENGKTDVQTFQVTNNYRPIIVLIAALIAMIWAYYRFRSPIVILKSISKVMTREGGISGLKIIVLLKSRSNRTLENIKIVERIPNIAELEKDFEVGTLKPNNVVKGKSTTSVTWELASLEPFEERVITYHIRSRLSVLGGFNLPHAVAKYVTKKGKEVIVVSNKIELLGQLIE